jgi:hypothetical protein
MTSADVRSRLVDALRLDLVGPDNRHAFAHELLPQSPTRWYLTGFLAPVNSSDAQRSDPTAHEEIDGGGESGAEEESPADRAAARKSFFPSSIGLSVLVRPGTTHLNVTVEWGDYAWESADNAPEPDLEDSESALPEADPRPETSTLQEPERDFPQRPRGGFRRNPRTESITIPLIDTGNTPQDWELPNAEGLKISFTSQPVAAAVSDSGRIPADTWSVSVFLVNHRPVNSERAYRAFAYQASLTVESPEPFFPRPDLRGSVMSDLADEWDERVGDLQYRDVREIASGHNVSVSWPDEPDVTRVQTTWVPSAEVERVAAAPLDDVTLSMDALAALQDGDAARAALSPLVDQYRDWIAAQRRKMEATALEPERRKTADGLLANADCAASRIASGIALLSDPDCLEAFRLANQSMALAASRRQSIQGSAPQPPEWRPFQLAFILMNLQGISDPAHADREVVDLLFFPTGGGKTEAYLGLAAFTLVLRRFRNPGRTSGGLSVLMRYTLRLLTLDQLGRAAALMCALELARESNPQRLGLWPFEIGLWVGSASTPNRMGHQGYTGPGADDTAYIKTKRFNGGEDKKKHPSPIPLEDCPWCGTRFEGSGKCFRLTPNERNPSNLRLRCANHRCEFSGDRWLPILGVDEPIYRRLPAFIIATVDKFAALPWTGETGALLGHVDRFDNDGYYGPCTPGTGQPLGCLLPGPDLIIQDELHLISGPLGTIAGVYETAIDSLCSRTINGRTVRPKIIASTATVRRATNQIRALFGRSAVDIFPPQGPDRTDSFFALTEPATVRPARQYIGVAAPGRSLKVVLLRTALALLSAGQTMFNQLGGKGNPANPADPYMSLLAYFNSLRELGGSRRIIEDEVRSRLERYDRRRRLAPPDDQFSKREIAYEVLELTSRVSTSDVAATKRRLGLPFHHKESVDIALATNMISVGLDIVRLGLMVVLGQPKASAEYIQATSRVGRDPTRPGLVVTLLNIHKPRDRSHYERFGHYHRTFYRSVEATSVTPFAPRALDRALAASLVGLCRQHWPQLTPALGARDILALHPQLAAASRIFAERAAAHDQILNPVSSSQIEAVVRQRCDALLSDWLLIAQQLAQSGVTLQYQRESTAPSTNRLLHEFLNPDLAAKPAVFRNFRANRSMRDVEPSIDLAIRNLNDWNSHP